MLYIENGWCNWMYSQNINVLHYENHGWKCLHWKLIVQNSCRPTSVKYKLLFVLQDGDINCAMCWKVQMSWAMWVCYTGFWAPASDWKYLLLYSLASFRQEGLSYRLLDIQYITGVKSVARFWHFSWRFAAMAHLQVMVEGPVRWQRWEWEEAQCPSWATSDECAAAWHYGCCPTVAVRTIRNVCD